MDFIQSANSAVKSQGLAFYKGGIIVNQFGKRFINESLSYKLLGNAAFSSQKELLIKFGIKL